MKKKIFILIIILFLFGMNGCYDAEDHEEFTKEKYGEKNYIILDDNKFIIYESGNFYYLERRLGSSEYIKITKITNFIEKKIKKESISFRKKNK